MQVQSQRFDKQVNPHRSVRTGNAHKSRNARALTDRMLFDHIKIHTPEFRTAIDPLRKLVTAIAWLRRDRNRRLDALHSNLTRQSALLAEFPRVHNADCIPGSQSAAPPDHGRM